MTMMKDESIDEMILQAVRRRRQGLSLGDDEIDLAMSDAVDVVIRLCKIRNDGELLSCIMAPPEGSQVMLRRRIKTLKGVQTP